MDSDVIIRFDNDRMEFLLRVFECALRYDDLNDEEIQRVKYWESTFKYMEDINAMCVRNH